MKDDIENVKQVKGKSPCNKIYQKTVKKEIQQDICMKNEFIEEEKKVKGKSSLNRKDPNLVKEEVEQDIKVKNESDDSVSFNFHNTSDSGISSENLSDFVKETILRSEPSFNFSSESKQNKDDSSSESEWEEVEDNCETNSLDDYKPKIPKEGVEITIDYPELRIRKRKKKKIDQNECIRLRINRIRKEIQLHVHKTHLLCLLAHGIYVNKVLNRDIIKSFALSLIPDDILSFTAGKKVDKIDVHGIEKVVSWFRSAFSFENKKLVFLNLLPSLVKGFQTTVAMNASEYNLLFIVFARILGFKVRYCVSLYPLTYKASNLLAKPNSKKKSKSECPDNSEKSNDKDSGEKKSKYFEKSKKTKSDEKLNKAKSKKEKNSKTPKEKKEKSSGTKKKNITENEEKISRSRHSSEKNYKLSSDEEDDDDSDKDFETDNKSSHEEVKHLLKLENLKSKKGKKFKTSKQKTETSSVSNLKNITGNKEKISRPQRSFKKNYKLSSDEEDYDDDDDEDFEIDNDSSDEEFKHSLKLKNLKSKKGKKSKTSKQKTGKLSVTNLKNITGNKGKISRPCRSSKKNYKLSSDEGDYDDDSDSDFEIDNDSSDEDLKKLWKLKPKRRCERKSKTPNHKLLSFDLESSSPHHFNFDSDSIICWAEIYSKPDKSWISIECVNNIVNKPYGIESLVPKPITYVLTFDNESFVKDVTRRYCSEYMTTTVKLRVDPGWWEATLQPFLPPNSIQNKAEEKKLDEILVNKPLPTTVQGFKNHPLYCLKRHLLKFEAIYPPDAPPVGFLRGEPIYARDCVHQLRPREKWVKEEARVVRIGEQPYKIVTTMKWDKIAHAILTDVPLEVFGYWQTEPYEPPVAVNGKVPRSEYGNVELFKPYMLPRGTVHLKLPGLNRIARKLGIDCSPAVIGFDGHKARKMRPVFDGFVICEEFKDKILAAWDEEQENIRKREEEKREKRIYGNWKKLIKGLLIRERIKLKYKIESNEKSKSIKSQGTLSKANQLKNA